VLQNRSGEAKDRRKEEIEQKRKMNDKTHPRFIRHTGSMRGWGFADWVRLFRRIYWESRKGGHPLGEERM